MLQPLAAKERALVEQYLSIPDPQERLAYIIRQKSKLDPLPGSERREDLLVQGCQSSVWIDGRLENGVCRFRADSDSPLVRGLVMMIVGLFDGAEPADAATFHPSILDDLGITRNLTPTRLNGMNQVTATLRRLAVTSLQ